MRCLALAQAWAEAGGQAGFLLACEAPIIQSRLTSEGFSVDVLNVDIASAADAAVTRHISKSRAASWLVLDGYAFGTEFQRAVRGPHHQVLQIDDCRQAERFEVDALLNQNIYARPAMYEGAVAAETGLFLGSSFALLRREFWPWRGRSRGHSGRIRNIVLTFGGGDADNVTLKVMQGIEALAPAELAVTVIAGANNPHWSMLRDAVRKSRFEMRMEQNVADMPALVAGAELAICGGGATCWEMAFLGLPMITIVLADNQARIAAGLDEAGIALNLGRHETVTPTHVADAVVQLQSNPVVVASMSTRGRQLIDGFGAARVVEGLTSQSLGRGSHSQLPRYGAPT